MTAKCTVVYRGDEDWRVRLMPFEVLYCALHDTGRHPCHPLRDEADRKRLYRWAMEAMHGNTLKGIERDLDKPSTTNCGFFTYELVHDPAFIAALRDEIESRGLLA